MSQLPALNVVIVAYGPPHLLERCLTALGSELATVVIDNSSNDSVRDIAVAHGCHYVDPGRNLGFAAGVNRGLAELGPARGDVLLLNPDALIPGATAIALQRALRAPGSERLACAAPMLEQTVGQPERVEWPFPSPTRAWLDAFGLGAWWRRSAFVIGAVLLLRDEAIDDVGSFDERFFLYAEETIGNDAR